MLRDDQIGLLRWVLAAAGPSADVADLPPLPDISVARFQAAGLATGLTAAIGALARVHDVQLPVGWREFADEQVRAVAARQRQYTSLAPIVLRALADAGVSAVPVKGVVLAERAWPVPDARPMADIDLIVRPADRERAVRALVAAGLDLWSRSPAEDVLLAWGDGSRGVTDRESAAHNGKVELHPGWTSEVHHYAIDDAGWLLSIAGDGELAGAPCRMLSPTALAAHALGHLSVGTIRAEVRALNVVDVALLLAAFDTADAAEFVAACDRLDPRFVAPGLWLVNATRPAWLRPPFEFDRLVARQLARLPAGASDRLRMTRTGDVLREYGRRTTIGWRLAFATSAAERRAVLRQAVTPRARDLAADAPDEPVWRLQGRRAARAAGRARTRLGGRA